MPADETVGRVHVDVVPDADNFGKQAEAQLKRQRIDPKNVNLIPVIDANMAALQSQVTAIAQTLDRNATIQVETDFSAVRGIDGLIGEILPVSGLKLHASWDPASEAGLRKTLASIEQTFATRHELLVDATTADNAVTAIRSALDGIERERVRIAAELVLDERRLAQSLSDMHLRLEADFDFSGARAKFETQMRLLEVADWKVEVGARVVPSLLESKAAEVRTRLASLFHDVAASVQASLSDSHYTAAQAALGVLTRVREVLITPEVNSAARAAAVVSLALLTRTRTVQIAVGRGLLNVGSVLSGLTALSRGLDQSRVALLGLFTNLPNVAGATTAIFGLAGAALSAAATFASLAGSAAQALPILLALPGIAIGVGVMALALKDFGTQLPGVVSQLKQLQPLISNAFWGQAKSGIESLASSIMGPLKSGLAATATEVGRFSGTFASSLGTALAGSGGLSLWFDNLVASIQVFSPAISGLVSIFMQFGQVGSAMLVPLAALAADLVGRFDGWFASLVAGAGGIQGFAAMTVAAVSGIIETVIQLGAVFGAVFRAAQDSGAATFTSISESMRTWSEGGGLVRLQERLTTLFTAASTMWDNFSSAATSGTGSALDNITKLLSAVLPVVGTIMGTVTSLLASIVTPEATAGIQAFVAGISAGIQALQPAFAAIGPLIGQLGPVLGQLATIVGQVFGALAPSIGQVLAALGPLIATLGGGLVKVIQALMPAVNKLATALATVLANPALTAAIGSIVSALVALAPALMPIIDLAARLVTALMPVVAAILEPIAGLITQLVPLLDPIVAVVMGIVSAILPLIPMLVNLVNAVIQPLLPLLMTLATAILPILTPIIQVLATVLQLVMLALQPILEFALPVLAALLVGLVGIIGLVVTAIAGFVQGALQWVQDGIAKVSDSIAGFGDKWRQIWQNVFDFFRQIWTGLLNWIKNLLGIHSPSRWFLDLAENMLQGMLDGLKAGWAWVTGFLSDVFNRLQQMFFESLENAKGIVLGAWEKITMFFSEGIDKAKTFVSEGFRRVVALFSNGITEAVDLVSGLPGKIVGVLGGIGNTLYQSGKDLVQGLLNGIGSLASSIGSWFLDKIPGWIREPFKAALGIRSPSTVFYGFGESIIEGLIGGMESQYRNVFRSMGTLAAGVAETKFNLPSITGGGLAAVAAMVSSAYAGQSSRTLVYNNYGPTGMSSEEDLFAAVGRGRAWGF